MAHRAPAPSSIPSGCAAERWAEGQLELRLPAAHALPLADELADWLAASRFAVGTGCLALPAVRR
eukprot:scaffold1626_cov372-Prasinococcus_capsulatus_cf.AAC.25